MSMLTWMVHNFRLLKKKYVWDGEHARLNISQGLAWILQHANILLRHGVTVRHNSGKQFQLCYHIYAGLRHRGSQFSNISAQ